VDPVPAKLRSIMKDLLMADIPLQAPLLVAQCLSTLVGKGDSSPTDYPVATSQPVQPPLILSDSGQYVSLEEDGCNVSYSLCAG
jgi:hypothetical protein